MKRSILAALCAAMLVACGDDNSSSAVDDGASSNSGSISSSSTIKSNSSANGKCYEEGMADLSIAVFADLKDSNCTANKSTWYNKANGTFYKCDGKTIVGIKMLPCNIDDGVDENGILTDKRDGQTYRTVKIGTQRWMAENLNYKTDSSHCYEDSVELCTKYGRHYLWADAMNACPSGWHLPSVEDFKILAFSVAGDSAMTSVNNLLYVGKVLKSKDGWRNDGNGTDDFGFSVIPAGHRESTGDSKRDRVAAYFWSSTEYSEQIAYYLYFEYNSYNAELKIEKKSLWYHSVRCVKD